MRGHNEGSIYQRQDGRYVAAVSVIDAAGKPSRKYFYGGTRAEVSAKLTKALRDQQQGIAPPPERETVGTYLARWLDDTAQPALRPRTFTSYRMIVTRHLVPALGRKRLSRLTPQDVQAYMNGKRAAGLSARTVQYHRAVLRKALNDALKWGLVARNAAALATPPKQDKARRRYLTPAEAREFLDTVRGHRLEALFTVGLALGLRQGEALGLRRQDVDWDSRVLQVGSQLQRIDGDLTLVEPKSDAGRRAIPLPEAAVHALRDHRRRQLEERVVAGPLWEDQDLVFCTQLGRPLDARNVTRQFHRLREQAGLPWLTFHGLRHGYASLLAAQGVNPRVAMELLGHSQLSLTLEVYTHVAPELARDAAARIDRALGTI